jgi:hypothetical protein
MSSIPLPTGSPFITSSAEKSSPIAPIPLRPVSPPPPPRKLLHGLPPSYLAHLNRLLRQWLSQQTRDASGLPGQVQVPGRLWEGETLENLGKALWEGCILSTDVGDHGQQEKKSLLGMDWNTWVLSSAARRKAWGDEQREATGKFAQTPGSSRPGVPDSRALLGASSIPTSPLPSSTTSTPNRGSSRAPSISSHSGWRPETVREVAVLSKQERDGSDAEDTQERVRRWCCNIARLDGYQRYTSGQKDEWEVLDGTP